MSLNARPSALVTSRTVMDPTAKRNACTRARKGPVCLRNSRTERGKALHAERARQDQACYPEPWVTVGAHSPFIIDVYYCQIVTIASSLDILTRSWHSLEAMQDNVCYCTTVTPLFNFATDILDGEVLDLTAALRCLLLRVVTEIVVSPKIVLASSSYSFITTRNVLEAIG